MDVAAPRPRVAAPEDETFPNGTFLATALALLAVRGAPVRRTDPPPRHVPRPAAPPPPAAAARRRRRRAAAREHCDARAPPGVDGEGAHGDDGDLLDPTENGTLTHEEQNCSWPR